MHYYFTLTLKKFTINKMTKEQKVHNKGFGSASPGQPKIYISLFRGQKSDLWTKLKKRANLLINYTVTLTE